MVSSVAAYEGPQGAQADYGKAVQIIFFLRRKLLVQAKKGGTGDYYVCPGFFVTRFNGGRPSTDARGRDARLRSEREPCVHFLQGKCRKGAQCRFRHIQPPNKNGNRRIFNAARRQGGRTSSNSGNSGTRTWSRQPGRRQHGGQQLTCYNCGLPGHFKKDCKSQNFVRAAFDFALPAVELCEPVQDKAGTEDVVNIAEQKQFERPRVGC